MAERIDQALYFTVDVDVDWTNNSCEQAIRVAKLQAKISGSWRSMRGLKAFCRIRSSIATARAHDVPVLHRAARRLPRQPLEHPSNRVTASVNPRDQGLP
jgi:Transposase IS66 family